jgi:hypothetical protein
MEFEVYAVRKEIDCFPIHDTLQSGTGITNTHSIKIGRNSIKPVLTSIHTGNRAKSRTFFVAMCIYFHFLLEQGQEHV